MRAIGRFITFMSLILTWDSYSQSIDLSEVDLSKLTSGGENAAEVFRDDYVKVFLNTGYCSDDKSFPSKASVEKRVVSFLEHAYPIYTNFEKLLLDLDSDLLKSQKKAIFPVNIYLSIDGNDECVDGSAHPDTIYLPLPMSDEHNEGIVEIFSHEIAHTIQEILKFSYNQYTETFADIVSLLLREGKEHGFLKFKAGDDFSSVQQALKLIKNDREMFKREYKLSEEEVKLYVWTNKVKYCASDDYVRDFSQLVPLEVIYQAGGDPYATSCIVNSFIYNLSGLETGEVYYKNLLHFLKSYFVNPKVFNNPNISEVLSEVYPGKLERKDYQNLVIESEEKIGVSVEKTNGWIGIKMSDEFVARFSPTQVFFKVHGEEEYLFAAEYSELFYDSSNNLKVNIRESYASSDDPNLFCSKDKEIVLEVELLSFDLLKKQIKHYKNTDDIVLKPGCYVLTGW